MPAAVILLERRFSAGRGVGMENPSGSGAGEGIGPGTGDGGSGGSGSGRRASFGGSREDGLICAA
jgi:hypothetical protein